MKRIYKELIIYFILAIIVSTWGYSAFLTNMNLFNEKYTFLFNLYLMGVFVGTISHFRNKTKIKLLSEIILIGSIGSIIFLGLQGISFNPKLISISQIISLIIPFCSTITCTIMFTGLIGITVEMIESVFVKLKNPIGI
ncbi:MAG: hypothetical protein PF542_05895 [Nanoarchaeota archaeon]|jgi:hypothetical protein|nr:hypothetical protein [Nanoarchaeota archaeon]